MKVATSLKAGWTLRKRMNEAIAALFRSSSNSSAVAESGGVRG